MSDAPPPPNGGKWELTYWTYSRVYISSDTAFFKILKKPSIVQK